MKKKTSEPKEEPKELLVEAVIVKSEEPAEEIVKTSVDVDQWQPRTGLGKKVKSKDIKDIDPLLDQGAKILEPEIIDMLLPQLKTDLLLIGQAKGKFGGGQRRVFKQTQKKTKEGNKPSFCTYALVGDENGHIGLGSGRSRETVPAREKAMRKAKLNVIKVLRGCGSWQCSCKEPHSIPFKAYGKVGSVKVYLYPAPKGTGLVIEPELGKLLKAAGIKDIWSKTLGHTKTKTNAVKACFEALQSLLKTKYGQREIDALGIIEGSLHAPQEFADEQAKHHEQP